MPKRANRPQPRASPRRWLPLAALVAAACAGPQKPTAGAAKLPEGTAPGSRAAAPEPQVANEPDPGRARDLFEDAVRESKSDPLRAAATFERAFAADPGLGLAAYNAGVLWERAGDVGRASDAYSRTLRVNPDFEPASQNLTRLRIRNGKADEAERDLRARIAAYPASLGFRNQLVEVLIASGRLDAAEQEARKVLKSDERDIQAMVNLSMVYYAKKRYELSKMVLENARQVDPSDPIIWNKLGFVEIALGNRPQALESFKKAASLRADYPEAHVNYGAMLVDAEDFAGAVKELELAVQHAPNNAPARLDLGNAYRGNRQFELAQREYERALQLDHRLADAYFNLGVLHLDGDKPGLPATERLEKAIAYFDRYAASGGTDPKLGQHRRDAALLLDKEKKRQAREEKDRLRKEAEARKKEEGRKAESAAREAEEAKGRAPAVPVPKPAKGKGPAPAPGGKGEQR